MQKNADGEEDAEEDNKAEIEDTKVRVLCDDDTHEKEEDKDACSDL